MTGAAETMQLGQARMPDVRLIAFAMTVVQSKPEHLSILEHVQQLRQHIVPGPRQHNPKHLDIVGTWKSNYETSQDNLKAARAETARLQLQLEQAQSATAKATKKQANANRNSLSPQKSLSASSPAKLGPNRLEVLGDLGVQASNGSLALLLKHLSEVFTVFDQQTRLDPHALAFHLVNAIQSLREVVRSAVQDSHKNDLETTLTGLSRAISYLHTAIARLSRSSRGAETEGRVIYAYVDAFSQMLDLLDGTMAAAPTGPASQQLPNNDTGVAKSGPYAAILLVRFLCTMIARLNTKIAVHKALLDGYSFCVLRRAGDRLYTLIYGHKKRPTMQEEIAYSASAYSRDDADTEKFFERDQDFARARGEACYILQLVKCVREASERHQDKALPRHVLNNRANQELQDTLMRCTFRFEEDEEPDPFTHCLKMPLLPLEPLPEPKTKETSITDWFVQEMWEMIGWDILIAEK